MRAARALRREHGLGRLFARALQLLGLLLVLDVSGAVHAALDTLDFALGHAHAQGDCEGDADAQGHECPPGCPNCHCVHAASPGVPPALAEARSFLISRVVTVQFTPARGISPSSASPDALFRPPRPLT